VRVNKTMWTAGLLGLAVLAPCVLLPTGAQGQVAAARRKSRPRKQRYNELRAMQKQILDGSAEIVSQKIIDCGDDAYSSVKVTRWRLEGFAEPGIDGETGAPCDEYCSDPWLTGLFVANVTVTRRANLGDVVEEPEQEGFGELLSTRGCIEGTWKIFETDEEGFSTGRLLASGTMDGTVGSIPVTDAGIEENSVRPSQFQFTGPCDRPELFIICLKGKGASKDCRGKICATGVGVGMFDEGDLGFLDEPAPAQAIDPTLFSLGIGGVVNVPCGTPVFNEIID
jgi:hypothetical protein